MLLQTAQATHKYLDVLKSKNKLRTFSLLQFYDAAKKAKKSLLKLTELSELDAKITLKTWSFNLYFTKPIFLGRILFTFIYISDIMVNNSQKKFQLYILIWMQVTRCSI